MCTRSFTVNQNQIMVNIKSKLSPEYISGFVDGEGCFGFQFRKDVRHERPGSPTYYYWKVQFMITARKDEQELFERIKEFFGCGNIYKQLDIEIHYTVTEMDDLKNIISPFFKKYQLQGKKKNDFILWAEAIDILHRNKKKKVNTQRGAKGFMKTNWDQKDLYHLFELHSKMQTYKSSRPKGLKHIAVAKELLLQDMGI